MKLRSLLLAAASLAIGVALIILLVRLGHIDVRATLSQLRSVNRIVFAELVLLTGFLSFATSGRRERYGSAVESQWVNSEGDLITPCSDCHGAMTRNGATARAKVADPTAAE